MATGYSNDRNANFWLYDLSTLPSSLSGTAYPVTDGACNGGVAIDTANDNAYLTGIFNGSDVQTAVLGLTSLPPVDVSGSPLEMSGGFRPNRITFDVTNSKMYISDPAAGLTAIDTSTLGLTLYTPGAGNIKAQGVCYDATNDRVYTCCQNSSNQDCLAVYAASTMTQITGSPFPIPSLLLDVSNNCIAYDSVNNKVLITANNPQGGLIIVDPTASYAPISGSPFSTGGSAPRGIAYVDDATYGKLIAVVNFGSNSLAIFNASGSTPSQITGSPFATGTCPNSVAYSQPYFLVTNSSGTAGAISVYAASAAYTVAQVSGSPFISGSQFIDVAVA